MAEGTWTGLVILLGVVYTRVNSKQCEQTIRRVRHLPNERQRNTTLFHHHGLRVCRRTFLFLHGVGDFLLRAVKAGYLSGGLIPRRHGHTGRVAPNALVLEDVRHIVRFNLHYAEAHAILLPGRIPGYKRDDIQILPCSTTKRAVWQLYREGTQFLSVKTAAYSTFTHVWRHLLPHIIVGRPMSDICWKCQKNSTAIIRSANLSEEVKSEVNSNIILCYVDYHLFFSIAPVQLFHDPSVLFLNADTP